MLVVDNTRGRFARPLTWPLRMVREAVFQQLQAFTPTAPGVGLRAGLMSVMTISRQLSECEKAGARHSSFLQASGALERGLYVRSSQIPDCPNEKQCPQSGADYGNRALAYSNFVWNEEQLRSVHYDG